jgi:hypothetical protein
MISISNLIRTAAENITAYQVEKDPLFIQLNKVIDLLKDKKYEQALHLITSYNITSIAKSKRDHWGHRIPAMTNALQAFDNAKKQIETKSPYALQTVLKSVQYLQDAESAINRMQHKHPDTHELKNVSINR